MLGDRHGSKFPSGLGSSAPVLGLGSNADIEVAVWPDRP